MEQYKIGINMATKDKFSSLSGKNTVTGHFYLGCQHERKKEMKEAIKHFK